MTKEEIRDELFKVRMELTLYKRDQEKCEKLEEEQQRLKKELATLLYEEAKQNQEEKNNNTK